MTISPTQIGFALLVLLVVNLFTWNLFATDKRRAAAGRNRNRIAERTLLGLATIGGSPAAWLAITRWCHKSSKTSFKRPLFVITGLQAGGLLGGLGWWLAG